MLKNFEDLERWQQIAKENKDKAADDLKKLMSGKSKFAMQITELAFEAAMTENVSWHVDSIVSLAKDIMDNGATFEDVLLENLTYFSHVLANADMDNSAILKSIQLIAKEFSESVEYLMTRRGAKLVLN